MYLGVMNYGAQYNRPEVYMRRKEYAPYFQDNWKATKRLTLNLGLRWEFRTPVYERTGSMMGFDLDKKAYVIGTDLNRFQALGQHAALDCCRRSELRRQHHHRQGCRVAAEPRL